MEITDEKIRILFAHAADLNVRTLCCSGMTLYSYAIDGLTTGNGISEYVIKPIMQHLHAENMHQMYDNALKGAVVNSVAKPCEKMVDAEQFLLNGFCLVLFPGVGAIAFEAKTAEKRSIAPPELENTAKGPRDSFTETLRTNTSLIRRHLRTSRLKIEERTVGKISATRVAVVWIDAITDPKLVLKMLERLESIAVRGLVSPSAAEECISGSRKTPFPMLQYTQRTDHFCDSLLGGRLGVLIDGLPLGYLLPVDLGYLMNSPEDVSRDFISASCVRFLRYAALLISFLLPAVYVAMTMYHWELIPSGLSQVIFNGRVNVPFSPAMEVLGLLIAFELLQESGVHLPQSIGQSVSVIGGIVVGTVGVEAGLISTVALICVSLAGVCGFVLPNRDLAAAVRVLRFAAAVAGAMFGAWGVIAVSAGTVIHLAGLKSMGCRYMKPFEKGLTRRRVKADRYKK